MSDKLVDVLKEKRDKKVALIDNLAQAAADQGRDLTEQDMQTITAATEEVRSYNSQLELLTVDLEIAETAAARIAGMSGSGAIPGVDYRYRSAGELLWDALHQTDQQAKNRYSRVMRRAAEHMGTVAANTTPVAGDLGGLVVRPNVGPVVDPYPSGMPFASAVGLRDVPSSDGYGFSRPQVVDTSFTTGVGPQALEKGELVSKAFTVTVTPVNLTTVGGYLNISQQLISFQSTALDIIVEQLRRRLENQIEGMIVDEAQLSTGHITLAAGADAAAVLKAIYDAAAAYYAITYSLPSWIAMGPLGWARLGSLVDLAGRPMFPTLGASNAPGTASAQTFSTTVAGLTPVVTPAITDDTFYVGGAAAIEGYLYRYPVLEAVEPSVLGRQVAVAASVAGYRPTPFANAIQHLAP